MLTDEELLKLEELEEKATPTPWVNGRNTYDGLEFDELPKGYSSWYLTDKADIQLVESLRNAAKSLIASARREKEYRAALKEIVSWCGTDIDCNAGTDTCECQEHMIAREALKKGDHE